MGFWGTIVVHRGEQLPEIEEFHEAELDYDLVNGAWQVSQVYAGLRDLPADLLPRLRDATGAPVLATEVFDSDGAFVHGLGARAECKAWLQLEGALGYLLTPYTIDGDESEYLRENDELRERPGRGDRGVRRFLHVRRGAVHQAAQQPGPGPPRWRC